VEFGESFLGDLSAFLCGFAPTFSLVFEALRGCFCELSARFSYFMGARLYGFDCCSNVTESRQIKHWRGDFLFGDWGDSKKRIDLPYIMALEVKVLDVFLGWGRIIARIFF
jgi:hypothetical protein